MTDTPYERDADGYIVDPLLVQTRAMDILELAVEVTARPDTDPERVVRPPRRQVDVDLTVDPPVVAPAPPVELFDAETAMVPAVDSAHAPDAAPLDVAGGDAATGADADATPQDAAPAIDPRLEQRRAGVVSDSRRRRRRRIGYVLGAILLGAGAVGALYSPLLDVDSIQIIGTSQLTAAEVASDAGLRVGDPMAFVDPSGVQSKLRRDPRFVRVVVSRQFPSIVTIRVTDRRAIAVVMGPSRGVVVGEDGMIIAVARGDELLRHVEVTADPPMTPGRRLAAPLSAAVDVLGSMSFEIAAQIQKMSITPGGELVFDLGEGRTVLFGTVEDADRKLLATKTMLGPQVDPSGLCQLDVRVPTAPTIRRNPDCDPPKPTEPVVDPAAATPAPDPTATTAPPPTPTPTTAPGAVATDPTAGAPQD